jgi:prevent-host-death family protein
MILSVSSTLLRRRLGQLLEAIKDRRVKVVVTRGGAPAAALVDIASLDRLRKFDEEFEAMRREFARAFGDVSSEQVESFVAEATRAARKPERP